MPEDRRSTRRARLSGVRVAYESAGGEVHQADVTDMSREGLFISSAKPLGVGKRISLEVQVAGEPGPWAALGRIVWVRQASEGDELPPGMAVKIIDMDDSVAAAIDRLIETRERTEPGLGDGDAAPKDLEKPRRQVPAREKTMLGVGLAVDPSPTVSAASAAPGRAVGTSPPDRTAAVPAPGAAAARPLPSREKTIVGVGQGVGDTREASLAIDLVAKKPASVRPSPAATEPHPAAAPEAPSAKANDGDEPEGPAEPTHPRVSETPAPRRRSGSGWLLLMLLVACGVGGYAFRDRLLPLWHVAVTMVTRQLH